ncbi:MAG: hypothetical protein IPK79_03010 [Vampirovibrionales bacterium]|nr:hypothetical protein [Vampirovibrionales bacterium]
MAQFILRASQFIKEGILSFTPQEQGSLQHCVEQVIKGFRETDPYSSQVDKTLQILQQSDGPLALPALVAPIIEAYEAQTRLSGYVQQLANRRAQTP